MKNLLFVVKKNMNWNRNVNKFIKNYNNQFKICKNLNFLSNKMNN